jgi:hypothetical protein
MFHRVYQNYNTNVVKKNERQKGKKKGQETIIKKQGANSRKYEEG